MVNVWIRPPFYQDNVIASANFTLLTATILFQLNVISCKIANDYIYLVEFEGSLMSGGRSISIWKDINEAKHIEISITILNLLLTHSINL